MRGSRPNCIDCKHYIFGKGARCVAFPEGIPDEIYIDGFDHTKPYFNDGGIRFEPIKSK